MKLVIGLLFALLVILGFWFLVGQKESPLGEPPLSVQEPFPQSDESMGTEGSLDDLGVDDEDPGDVEPVGDIPTTRETLLSIRESTNEFVVYTPAFSGDKILPYYSCDENPVFPFYFINRPLEANYYSIFVRLENHDVVWSVRNVPTSLSYLDRNIIEERNLPYTIHTTFDCTEYGKEHVLYVIAHRSSILNSEDLTSSNQVSIYEDLFKI